MHTDAVEVIYFGLSRNICGLGGNKWDFERLRLREY